MKAVAVVVLLFVASAMAQNSFCQRYAGMTAAGQKSLITSVVVRAAAGYSDRYSPANVTGLFFETNNKPYFDGTKAPNVNFITDSTQQAALVDHLVRFFSTVLGCVEQATAEPWTAKDLKMIHAGMMINKATMTAFINQVAGSIISHGVPAMTGPKDDLTYPAALLGIFNKGSPMEICIAADCDMWADVLSVACDDTKYWVAGGAMTVNTGNVIVGGSVNFQMTATDIINEAADATATTLKSGGLTTTTAGIRSWTKKFDTVGTYYFYSTTAPTTKRFTVNVINPPAMGSSTGMDGSSAFAAAQFSALAVAAAAIFAFVAQRA